MTDKVRVMNKPTTYKSVIVLCAIVSASALLPSSYAGPVRGNVVIDERGAPARIVTTDPIPDPVVRQTEVTNLKLNPTPSPVIRPNPVNRISVTPAPDPVVIRPSN